MPDLKVAGLTLSPLTAAVTLLTIDRLEQRNALSLVMWQAIPSILTSQLEQGTKVLVITGSHNLFCAGADFNDLRQIRGAESKARELWTAIATALNALADSKLVTIAAIDGPCLGGGCLLAVACDLRYASARSKFSVPVAKLGIQLDDANIDRLQSLIGTARTKEMLFTAGTIDSAEASRIGLINAVVSAASSEKMSGQSTVVDHCKEIALAIVHNSLAAVTSTKESIKRLNNGMPYGEAELKEVIASYTSEDFASRLQKYAI